MNKENWKKHIESLSGLVRPSLFTYETFEKRQEARKNWQAFLVSHCQGCKDCISRKRQQTRNLRARELNQVLRDITGTSARSARLDIGL